MSTINYRCHYDNQEWSAQICTLTDELPIEAVITGRGYSFDVIYGKYRSGYYLVIPSERIGCEMSCWKDKYWNRSSLGRTGLADFEAETIAEGILQLSARAGEGYGTDC